MSQREEFLFQSPLKGAKNELNFLENLQLCHSVVLVSPSSPTTSDVQIWKAGIGFVMTIYWLPFFSLPCSVGKGNHVGFLLFVGWVCCGSFSFAELPHRVGQIPPGHTPHRGAWANVKGAVRTEYGKENQLKLLLGTVHNSLKVIWTLMLTPHNVFGHQGRCLEERTESYTYVFSPYLSP